MTDTTPPDRDNAPLKPAEPARKPAVRKVRAGMSLIWLVPILALIVTLGVGWNAIAGRGVVISVTFKDATGIVPGETALKFREITVGKVESVRFTDDLQQVLVNIRVDKDLAPYIDRDAQFWIVRPQVSAQGISRLDTVLTGAFIEGHWDDKPDEKLSHFQGLDKPPASLGQKGTRIVLSTDRSRGMMDGAPVTFRGIQVGQMQNLRLSEDDESVLADVFIAAPHDRRLTTSSAFWDTSGFSVSLGAQGVSLNVNSLASVLQGGAEFATFTSGGQPVEDGHVFQLQPDEEAARANLFSEESNAVRLTMLIDESVTGLETGANVQFMGLTVGRVTDLAARVTTDDQGNVSVRAGKYLTDNLYTDVQVGGDGNDAMARLDGGNRAGEVGDFAAVVRVLEQRPEDFLQRGLFRRTENQLKTEETGTGFQYVDGLREAIRVNKE